jgi:tetratricopeptide (TPR) repeat protein
VTDIESPSNIDELETLLATAMDFLQYFENTGQVEAIDYAVACQQKVLQLTPEHSPDRADRLSTLANFLTTRFELLGDGDIHEVVEYQRQAVDLTPSLSPERPGRLGNLGTALMRRFQRFGNVEDIIEAIMHQRQGVELSPADSRTKIISLFNLTNSLIQKFSVSGELADISEAAMVGQNVMNSIPSGDPIYPAVLNSVASALGNRFTLSYERQDIDQAIAYQRTAIEIENRGRPGRARSFGNLAKSHAVRFEHYGNQNDLGQAIQALRQAIGLIPINSPARLRPLQDLGNHLFTRYMISKQIQDLDEAIDVRQAAAKAPSEPGDFDHVTLLRNLQNALMIRIHIIKYDPALGNHNQLTSLKQKHLDDAISCLRELITCTARTDPNRSTHFNNLASTLHRRHKTTSSLDDLNESVSMFRNCLEVTADGSDEQPEYVYNFGDALLSRFEQLGDPADIEEALSWLQVAVQLTSYGHPPWALHLSCLGAALTVRFEHYGKRQDVDEAISLLREATKSESQNVRDQIYCLTELGVSLSARFNRFGELEDLEESISSYEKALQLEPSSASEARAGHLSNLGAALANRYDRLGDVSDLQKAIYTHEKAVNLVPVMHSRLSGYLSASASALFRRFERTGDVNDVDAAIERLNRAISLTSPKNYRLFIRLVWLGACYIRRFEQLGNVVDIDNSISTLKKSVDAAPNHTDHASCLSHLATALLVRFQRLKNVSDLSASIQHHREAVKLTPADDPCRSSNISRLAEACVIKFIFCGGEENVKEGIDLYQQAVVLTPDHPERATHLSDLAVAHVNLYESGRNIADLDVAINLHQEALKILTEDNPTRAGVCSGLGNAMRRRYDHCSEDNDISEAISWHREAVRLTPAGHSRRTTRLVNLGQTQLVHSHVTGIGGDFDVAISSLCEAAESSAGSPAERFQAAMAWANSAHDKGLLDIAQRGYSVALELLPLLSWLGLDVQSRQRALMSQSLNLACDAAACAIALDDLPRAIEVLDEGRSIFWNQSTHLRADVDHLRLLDPALADAFEGACHELEAMCLWSIDQPIFSSNIVGPLRLVQDAESLGQRHRRLADKWDSLLEKIREKEQFQDFLRPLRFRKLCCGTSVGQVVMINISSYRCDALIVKPASQTILHVELTQITQKRVQNLHQRFSFILVDSGYRDVHTEPARASQRVFGSETTETGISNILEALWKLLVHPIIAWLDMSEQVSMETILTEFKFSQTSIRFFSWGIFRTFGGVQQAPLHFCPSMQPESTHVKEGLAYWTVPFHPTPQPCER